MTRTYEIVDPTVKSVAIVTLEPGDPDGDLIAREIADSLGLPAIVLQGVTLDLADDAEMARFGWRRDVD
jgi:hypothetical protein